MIFYINKEDKEQIKKHCELLQINPSFFIRNLVLEKLGKPTFQTKSVKIQTNQYSSQLNKIGVNLNQIAKKLNSGIKLQILDQKEILNSIKSINQFIVKYNSEI